MVHPSATPEALAALAGLLATPRRAVVTAHTNPDADALGSSLAWAGVLRDMGHLASVVLPDPAPANLRWMPGHERVVNYQEDKDAAEQAMAAAEIVFCLDFNRTDRLKDLEPAVRNVPLKVLIDHHRDPGTGYDVAFSDTSASSTCQMVHDVVTGLGKADLIDKNIATCLYAGLMTDSGSFRFPSTSPHTLRVAAAVMARGADPQQVYSAIMEDNSLDRLRLTGFALHERLQLHHGGEVAVIALSRADLERFNYVAGDTEGLVNQGLSVRGVRLSAFLAERKDMVKISLRSRGALPVNEFLSAHFQGGGHANAAGGRSSLSLEETVAGLMRELPAFLAAHPR